MKTKGKKMYKAQLKNKTAYGCKLRKMNNSTYKLRKNVMSIIYDANRIVKNYDGSRLPRVEVRIVKQSPCESEQVNGYAYLGANIIHIREDVAEKDNYSLYHTTYHELVHTLFNQEHDEKCRLMKAGAERITKEEAEKIFLNYYKRYNK
tara:strand:- start:51 stop:497 length:447 start_codon:yes stop_codon:yes gene_type:complete